MLSMICMARTCAQREQGQPVRACQLLYFMISWLWFPSEAIAQWASYLGNSKGPGTGFCDTAATVLQGGTFGAWHQISVLLYLLPSIVTYVECLA